jgi:hypothetical protein
MDASLLWKTLAVGPDGPALRIATRAVPLVVRRSNRHAAPITAAGRLAVVAFVAGMVLLLDAAGGPGAFAQEGAVAGKQKLKEVLAAVHKPVETYCSPDGSELMILPHGGRMLGLFAPASDENFYWTNTALQSADTAQAFYDSPQWQNSGGDRTWLAPEADVFFPNFPKLDQYVQPRQLDPGQYRVEKENGAIRLVNRLSLTLSRTHQDVDLEIAKSFGPAPNPLRYEPNLKDADDLEYAGYTQSTTLAIQGADAANHGPVGLWNLVQMPHEGELLVATYHRSEPRLIMGKIGPEDQTVGDHLIRYRMRATGEHKLSIRAVATTGRVGYLYQTGPRWALIVRNFFVDPSGQYVDAPWDDADYLGFGVQACNVKSGLGTFSELEYHIPAIGQGTGRTRCSDTSVVWAFRGSQEKILSVARALLGPEI